MDICWFLYSSMTTNQISLGCGSTNHLRMSYWPLGNTDKQFSPLNDILKAKQLLD